MRILPELLRYGFHVVWSDVDVAWFRDPTALLPRFPEVAPPSAACCHACLIIHPCATRRSVLFWRARRQMAAHEQQWVFTDATKPYTMKGTAAHVRGKRVHSVAGCLQSWEPGHHRTCGHDTTEEEHQSSL